MSYMDELRNKSTLKKEKNIELPSDISSEFINEVASSISVKLKREMSGKVESHRFTEDPKSLLPKYCYIAHAFFAFGLAENYTTEPTKCYRNSNSPDIGYINQIFVKNVEDINIILEEIKRQSGFPDCYYKVLLPTTSIDLDSDAGRCQLSKTNTVDELRRFLKAFNKDRKEFNLLINIFVKIPCNKNGVIK